MNIIIFLNIIHDILGNTIEQRLVEIIFIKFLQ